MEFERHPMGSGALVVGLSKAKKQRTIPLPKESADKTKTKSHPSVAEGKAAKLKNKEFEGHLARLQAELVKMQQWVQHKGKRSS